MTLSYGRGLGGLGWSIGHGDRLALFFCILCGLWLLGFFLVLIPVILTFITISMGGSYERSTHREPRARGRYS